MKENIRFMTRIKFSKKQANKKKLNEKERKIPRK